MYSLRAYLNGEVIFESSGNWLYPLFELEEYIKENGINAAGLFIEDKIAGRAAASLMVKFGIRKVKIGLISGYGAGVFKKNGVDFSYDELVEKIECKTEELITPEMTINEVYTFLRKRAGYMRGLSLNLKGLSAGYGKTEVLKGLDLGMQAGETLVIAGDNGSGKSTLLKVILGIHPPRAGAIEIDGKPGEGSGSQGRRIGYMNQIDNSMKDPVSAEEVVSIGLSCVRVKKEEASYRMELAMRRTGCFHLYGRNFHSLSGGEKQKVSLARCLCQEPGIFLMDEPTSFLDSAGREDFIEIINEMLLVEIPTVIIVTHDRDLIKSINWPVKTLKQGGLYDELPDY